MIAGDQIVKDMSRGAESYLQMWERAKGVPEPRCRSTHARFSGRGLGRVHLEDRPKQLLMRAGQPQRRRDRVWNYCVLGRGNTEARQVPIFTPGGSVGLITTTARGQRAFGVSRGMPVGSIPERANRVGGGFFTASIGGGDAEIVYRVGGGRVTSISVATDAVAASAKRLKRYLKLAGVG